MIQIVLGYSGLARIRFAPSPVAELVASLHVPPRGSAAAEVQDGAAHLDHHLPPDHVVVVGLGSLLERLAPVPRLAVTTAVTVSVMTWLVMPRVTRLLRAWLCPNH